MAVPPPSSTAVDDRAALRRTLRARRSAFVAALSPLERASHLAALEARLRPLLGREGPIAGYVAHRGEIDVLPVLIAAHHLGHRVALPRVTEETMAFVAWTPEAALAPGHAGIPEPDGSEQIEPAIVLAPLLGFDRALRRLGQGGGFYDRWFAAHPKATRIGIAWSVQEVPAIATAPWDMPLHAIATEAEWIES